MRAELTVELSGPLENLLGQDQVRLQVPSDCRIVDVFAALLKEHPQVADYFGLAELSVGSQETLPAGVLVVQDDRSLPLKPDTMIDCGQPVALMALVSGG